MAGRLFNTDEVLDLLDHDDPEYFSEPMFPGSNDDLVSHCQTPPLSDIRTAGRSLMSRLIITHITAAKIGRPNKIAVAMVTAYSTHVFSDGCSR